MTGITQNQPGANLYTQGFGSRPENVEVPHYDVRAPAATDINFPIGKHWIDTVGLAEYVLLAKSAAGGVITASWSPSAGGSAELSTLTGDTGTATPVAGNIKIAGTANQVVTSASGSTVTLALTGPYTPATYTAHGVLMGEGTSSIAASSAGTLGQAFISGGASADGAYGTLGVVGGGTGAVTLTAHGVLIGEGTSAVAALAAAATGTLLAGVTGADPAFTGSPSVSGSLTAATTITATLGAITATNGNFVGSTAGTGILLNSATTSGTTTATLNGRVGQITITTPSIAAGATFAMTITNSSITGSGTQVGYWLSGGTTGAALTIQSYANTASQSVVTVMNGTGATTNTASLILNFLVLN